MTALFAGVSLMLACTQAASTAAATQGPGPPSSDCCRHEELSQKRGVIWTGRDTSMTIERLAAYAAPILWLSPDEPLLKLRRTKGEARGREILIPEPFPFEDDPGGPVV